MIDSTLIKRLIHICLFLVLPCTVFAQSAWDSLYIHPKQIPSAYNFDIHKEMDKLSVEDNLGIKKKTYNRFISSVVSNKRNQIDNGEIYFGWTKAETYLNDILKRLLPDSIKNDQKMYVYLLRDPSLNAYSSYDGSIYFNVGLLADVENEAGIAFILGHEMAHYLKRHLLKSYISAVETNKYSQAQLATLAHVNQKLELEADEIGYELTNRAGYNLEAGYQIFDLIYGDNEKLATFNNERASKLSNYIDNIPTGNRFLAEFRIDPNSFNSLIKQARIEKLELLLNEFSYKECLRNAFLYHLADPKDHYYVYYAQEAARRFLLLFPKEKEQLFLIDGVYENQADINYLNKFVKNQLLINKIESIKQIDKKNLVLKSYQQILQYFSELSKNLSLPELYLSSALIHHSNGNTVDRNINLDNYIRSGKGRSTNFAKLLLGQRPTKNLIKTKKLIIIDDAEFYNMYEFNNIEYDIIKSEEFNSKSKVKLKEYIKNSFPGNKVIYTSDLSNTNFNSSIAYKKAILTALISKDLATSSNPLNIASYYMLDPSIYQMFSEESVQNIDYIYIDAFNTKGNTTNSASYLNPFKWASNLINNFFGGAKNYYYNLEHISINVINGSVSYSENEVGYRLSLPHLHNSIYNSLKAQAN